MSSRRHPPAAGISSCVRSRESWNDVGCEIELNRISGRTAACLYNSFNLEPARLRRFARTDVRMVHRIDGPIGAYRGFDDGSDRLVMQLNQMADVTILQSQYSLEKHRELGLEPRNPVVICNAPDPAIFHRAADLPPAVEGRPLRLIATSWSDNPRKGSEILAWLDRNLDPDNVALTFVGRTPARLEQRQVHPTGDLERARRPPA